jgi:hypothetical protein
LEKDGANYFKNGNELIVSGGFEQIEKAWSSDGREIVDLMSDHEEADTRIVLHAKEATKSGFTRVDIISRDTDVLVLLLAHRHLLCEEIWMQCGTRKVPHFVPVNKIQLNNDILESILAYHALTGCDTTAFPIY